ncbi:MAG TPA: hypothetical protein VD867_13455, partial [Burkholderiales bacterium]|nr:hypothetical protein [Burkholderiales bacterium]
TGTSNLGGTLTAQLVNGFVPAEGDTFALVTSANSTGTFANLQLPPGATAAGTPQAFIVRIPLATPPQNPMDLAMEEATRLNERFVESADIRDIEPPKGRATECN